MAFRLPVGIQERIKTGLLSSLLATCLFAVPPADKPKPGVVAGAKKSNYKITVDELREMSCIGEFTDTEELLLERVSNSPQRTRDALVRMMKKRRDACKARNQQLLAIPTDVRMELVRQGRLNEHELSATLDSFMTFDSQIPKMKAIKFN